MSATVNQHPFPVIDFHAHINDAYVRQQCAGKTVISGYGTRELPGKDRGARDRELLNPDAQVEDMDKAGIDVNVLTVATVMHNSSWAPPALDLELCRHVNNTVASWVAKYPKRFVGTFILPLQDMTLAMSEFDRCVSELKMQVVQLPSNAKGAYLGEPVFKELWSAIHQGNLTAMIHPEGTTDLWFQKFRMWNSLGQPLEEAKVMASLIYEGVLERHPGLKVVISHGGGMMPHYMGRFDRNVYNMPDSMVNITKKPSEYLRHLYYDSCVYTADTLRALIKIVGADRIILGSDYPVGDPNRVDFVRDVVSPEDFRMIASTTPSAILGLARQSQSAKG